MTTNKTFNTLAAKLGFSEEERLLKKAAEFERLLQTKPTANSIMSDTSKIVICLDLAASIFGSHLDTKLAIKYSGLKGPTYSNYRKLLENLLEINSSKLSVLSVCLMLQCGGVQDFAERILKEYQMQAKTEIDLDLPQYVCMAVYQACRINKVKVPKSKILEKSRLKPAQWAKLDADWTKFVDANFAAVKMCKKNQKNVEKDDEAPMEIETQCVKEEKPLEPKIESYQAWKKRILEISYKELKELEQKNKTESIKEDILRRSPRKTPQKFSPYKNPLTSPRKANGVRLLFPKDL